MDFFVFGQSPKLFKLWMKCLGLFFGHCDLYLFLWILINYKFTKWWIFQRYHWFQVQRSEKSQYCWYRCLIVFNLTYQKTISYPPWSEFNLYHLVWINLSTGIYKLDSAADSCRKNFFWDKKTDHSTFLFFLHIRSLFEGVRG